MQRSDGTWNPVNARGGIVKVRGEHIRGIMEEESYGRNHKGGIMRKSNHEAGIMEGGIMEDESYVRNHR